MSSRKMSHLKPGESSRHLSSVLLSSECRKGCSVGGEDHVMGGHVWVGLFLFTLNLK